MLIATWASDTAPERLREARDSGAVLLHKPVEPEALRHAMAALLAGKVATSEPIKCLAAEPS